MSEFEWFDSEENMTPPDESGQDTNPLLDENAFQNEQSRKLFEAIDELRSCGANNDIELPEVRSVPERKIYVNPQSARYRWGPVGRKIQSPAEFDRHSISSGWQIMHTVPNTYSITEDAR